MSLVKDFAGRFARFFEDSTGKCTESRTETEAERRRMAAGRGGLRVRRWIVLIAACGVVQANPVAAWDSFGHELIANVAWRQMSPEARQQAIALLDAVPEDADLASLRPPGADPKMADRRLFELAATWPDIVRDREFPERNAKYHHGNWHYVNWYWRQDSPGAKGRNVSELPTDETHILERIVFLTRTLGDESIAQGERGIALAWVLHLVGDLHQPLHTGSRVTELEPDGDRGGNLFEFKEGETLHWYWDQLATKSIRRRWFEPRARWVARGAQRSLDRQIPADLIKPGDASAWTRESHARVLEIVYLKDVERGRMPSSDYRRRSWQAMEPIVALAGVRLGDLLETALTQESGSP